MFSNFFNKTLIKALVNLMLVPIGKITKKKNKERQSFVATDFLWYWLPAKLAYDVPCKVCDASRKRHRVQLFLSVREATKEGVIYLVGLRTTQNISNVYFWVSASVCLCLCVCVCVHTCVSWTCDQEFPVSALGPSSLVLFTALVLHSHEVGTFPSP